MCCGKRQGTRAAAVQTDLESFGQCGVEALGTWVVVSIASLESFSWRVIVLVDKIDRQRPCILASSLSVSVVLFVECGLRN